MTLITRAASGLRAPTGAHLTDRSNRKAFAVHWDGGETPKTTARAIELLKAYDRHHRNQGWGGLGYNLAVDPVSGDVYEGRGLGYIGAHAGGANTATIGCILIGGPGNLTEAGKQGLRDAYALAVKYVGRELTQRVHSDINNTSCPGDEIRAWVRAGGLKGGNVPTVAPSGLLKVDGELWTATVGAAQRAVGTFVDGFISEPFSAFTAEVQRRLNARGRRDWDGKPLKVDGQGIHHNSGRRVGKYRTLWALQQELGVTPDGWLDANDSLTVRRMQERLNAGTFLQ